MTIKKKRHIFMILLISLASLLLIPGQKAIADEGVGITGSFSTYDYKIVQGETIDTPLVNVVLVNKFDYEIRLKIYEDTPDGISLNLSEEEVTIAANSRVDIPVVISAAEDSIPGEYSIYVRAKLIQEEVPGKVNIGSEYALKAQITVYGEAADLNIDIVDEVGEPIKAVMNLYQLVDDSRVPHAYSNNGILVDRVIPGDYEIFAFWNDYQLARYQFTVAADEQFQKTLVANTVQIYGYTVSPVFVENSKTELATANIKFVLHNIYKQLNNARVVLVVYKNDEVLEQKDVFLYETLEVNRHDMGFNYVPAQGWDKAEYKFVIEFYVDEQDDAGNIINSTLYATSLPAFLDVSGFSFKNLSDFFNGRLVLIILLAALLVGVFLFIKYIIGKLKQPGAAGTPNPTISPVSKKSCPDCEGHGTILCPVCDGKGKTLYELIEEECLYCNGAGEVMCGTCINPKHLIACPKCHGEQHVLVDGRKSECTYCNGLGHIVDRQHAVHIDGVRLKLGKKNR